jgi:hypothetical protein
MNLRISWLLAAALLPTTSVVGQSTHGPLKPLKGVWRAVEVIHGAAAVTIRPGPNLAIFADRVDVHTEKPRPVLANAGAASAEELRDVWGPVVAEAETYELTNHLITLQPIVAKNPAAMAPDVSIVDTYKLRSGCNSAHCQACPSQLIRGRAGVSQPPG